jgi:hypothetical protein
LDIRYLLLVQLRWVKQTHGCALRAMLESKCTDHDNREEQLALEVSDIIKVVKVIQGIASVDPSLREEVAIATDELRWPSTAQTEVLKL